ncbi:hypothetical protein B7P34_13485 [Streptosporangium nondiastaticum]|uniref:Uncharacterized protein n=1 Tax=Streptosporangium nondiastaticum TaxID=35764 RepID=A0A9X7PHJ7_9ACTN|nr:proteasome accessory factor PafA2 family protein [Streptosporangium nondiastaticum]PSJ28240.1 hypothetical protein B7P34_13485 [Streptosporangium nondiastaticum]
MIIIGTEVEYLIYEVNPQRLWVPDPFAYWRPARRDTLSVIMEQIANSYPAISSRGRLWLANGACVYIDGNLLEYASPECFTSVTASACEHAGAEIVGEACKQACSITRKDIKAFARCAGPDGMEAGYHENYGLPPEQYFQLFHKTFWPTPRILGSVVTHLISRIIWSGKGEHSFSGDWLFSPRGARVDRVWDLNTETHRPIIHVKRPNMEDDLLRIEITCGDFNSPTMTTLKLGSTAAVLLAASQGVFDDMRITVSDPVKSMRSVAKSLTAPITLKDGSTQSCLSLQWNLLSRLQECGKEIDKGGPHFNWSDSLDLWEQILAALENHGGMDAAGS